MSWWIYLIFGYLLAVLLFHLYVRFSAGKKNFDGKYLPVVIEPWFCPFLGPILSMLDFEPSLKRWQAKYGENFTLRILGKYLTVITNYSDLKRYYNATDEALSLTRAAQFTLGSAYPENQYMVKYSSIPYLQMILTPVNLRYMSTNIEAALFDYFNHQSGQFWTEHGDGAVIDIFKFMYQLVVRMNAVNFASPRIYREHLPELIDLFSVLDAEKSVMNPFSNTLKKKLGLKSARDAAWERWIQLLMPDIERSLKMIEEGSEPTDIDVFYTVVKYAKDELEKHGEKFTPRLVAFLVYSSFLPAQLNTYATASFVLLQSIRHENDEIGQRIQEEIQRAPPMGESTIQDLNSMEYIQACIYEVIRLSTDSQLSVRHAGQDVPLSNGKYIPSGNLVATCFVGSHALYSNPTKFDPERSLPPRDEHKSDPYRILPFGRGKHPCTGERYVKIQIKLLLVQLYRLCKMEIMKESMHFEETINRKQLAGLSRPTKPVYVRISKREG